MSRDPYAQGLITFDPFVERKSVAGRIVTVLDGKLDNRGIELIHARSRVLQKHEIHELIISFETDPAPGKRVDRIGYVGFFEVHEGGVIVSGDRIRIADKWSGTIAGFDETHVPNHINIVVCGDLNQTGLELGLRVGDMVQIGDGRNIGDGMQTRRCAQSGAGGGSDDRNA
ncbi:DUF6917 domain-containing protein [Paenibacillus hamazuiensis]|uniref:DUF6917 domain-containing protein n=1 Tax=Paenibacillus hamazuiensis TaxID=2936508 RepID=UPI00200F2D44|nr:hypothetical protein [Paenibacillus hamazuiensis]